MSAYRRKQGNSLRRIPMRVILLIAVLLIISMMLVLEAWKCSPDDSSMWEDKQEQQSGIMDTTDSDKSADDSDILIENIGIEFPVILEEGKIEIESIFPFSGINPDANRQEALDVAAVVVKNKSDSYLSTAILKAALADGTEQYFKIFDLPAGASMMVFSADNSIWEEDNPCVEVSIETTYEDTKEYEDVLIATNGMEITLENRSGEELSEVDVYCHEVLNGNYFGGVTYRYSIEKISVGESVTIMAADSILGVVDVVRMTADD